MSSSSGSQRQPESFNDSTDDLSSSSTNPLASLMEEGISPRLLLSHLAPSFPVPPGADDMMLWRLIVSMIEPPKRKKLLQYNTIEDAIDLIKKSSKIMVLSGAGISTSAGLPDFRSRDGIYVQIHAEHPDLNDPKSMFDIEYFRKNPLPFYQFAKALYPGQFKPTIGHQFIKCIEDRNKLLRNYTQNIDTLEKQAGIRRVVECHGSFARATCTNCKHSVDGDEIRADIFAQRVPKCPKCHSTGNGPEDALGVLKPNIVFFGEQLGDEFHVSLEADKENVDLLIVIGSSLKVRPVALIPRSIPSNVPQILINKEPLDHMGFDIELLGDCDHIIQELCLRLGDGWTKLCESHTVPLTQLSGPSVINLVPTETQVIETENKEAISESDQNSNDDEWEDVEILEDSSSDSDAYLNEKADVKLPESSFVFLKPNRYIFRGAELTRAQFDRYTNVAKDESRETN